MCIRETRSVGQAVGCIVGWLIGGGICWWRAIGNSVDMTTENTVYSGHDQNHHHHMTRNHPRPPPGGRVHHPEPHAPRRHVHDRHAGHRRPGVRGVRHPRRCTMTTALGRYIVRRTLSYAHTVYGRTDDLAEAERVAASRTLMGYPSEVIDSLDAEGSALRNAEARAARVQAFCAWRAVATWMAVP